MRTRTARPIASWPAVVGAAVLALVLAAGCSDSAEPSPTPQARPMNAPQNPVPVETPASWVAQVCTALAPAVRSAGPVPEIVPTDLPGSRDRMLAYLDQRIASFDRSAEAVNAAGPAPTETGLRTTASVTDLLRNRSATLARERADVQAVPAVAEQTLVNALEEARGRLSLAGGSTVALRDLALPPDLSAVAAGVPACQALQAG